MRCHHCLGVMGRRSRPTMLDESARTLAMTLWRRVGCHSVTEELLVLSRDGRTRHRRIRYAVERSWNTN